MASLTSAVAKSMDGSRRNGSPQHQHADFLIGTNNAYALDVGTRDPSIVFLKYGFRAVTHLAVSTRDATIA